MKEHPYHHGDLRATLLNLANQTVREQGAGELSLRALARQAGVSPGAPSRHFPNKQALLDALTLDGFNRLETSLRTALEQAGPSFADRIAALARAYVSFAISNAELLELMYGRKHERAASHELVAANTRLAALGTELVQAGQLSGDVRTGAAQSLSIPLSAALYGLAALALSGSLTAEQVQTSLDETVAVLLRGYAP